MYFPSHIATLLSLCVLPATRAVRFATEEVTASFEDRNYIPAGGALNDVEHYGGLHWTGFTVDSPRPIVDGVYPVLPHSIPNFAGCSIIPNKTHAAITASYTDSKVAFFDMRQFNWGCSRQNETHPANQRVGWCTLQVLGYARGAEKPTAKLESWFWPPEGVLSMEMAGTYLDGTFRSLERLEFNLLEEGAILYVDDLRYILFNVTSLDKGLAQMVHEGGPRDQDMRFV